MPRGIPVEMWKWEKSAKRFLEGEDVRAIAKEYEVSPSSIIQRARDYHPEAFKSKRIRVYCRPPNAEIRSHSDEIVEAYQNGMSQRDIGVVFNCSDGLVKRVLLENKISIRSKAEARRILIKNREAIIEAKFAEVVSDYKNGLNVTNLSQKYHCSIDLIRKILRGQGIVVKDRKRTKVKRKSAPKISSIEKFNIRQDKLKNLSKETKSTAGEESSLAYPVDKPAPIEQEIKIAEDFVVIPTHHANILNEALSSETPITLEKKSLYLKARATLGKVTIDQIKGENVIDVLAAIVMARSALKERIMELLPEEN